MYIPALFLESDLPTLQKFVETHSFAILVSQHDAAQFATHVPLLLDRDAGTMGTLLGHVARANPQWRQCVGQTVMAVFSGPHAYISPSWYEAVQVVPTWNYVAVHVYGRVEIIEEPAPLLDIVQRTVAVYERSMPNPWSLREAKEFVERQMKQIVGLRIEIERFEGKWKLNQNHPLERRRKVVAALEAKGDADSLAVAAFMQQQMTQPGAG